MKHRVHKFLAGLASLGTLALFGMTGASCEQSPIQCTVGHGTYIAKYTLVSGDDACYGLPAEEIAMSTYLGDNGDGTANYGVRKLSVQSDTMGNTFRGYEVANGKLAVEDKFLDPKGEWRKTNTAYGFGEYTTEPDGNEICYAGGGGVSDLSVAEFNFPDVDKVGTDGKPVKKSAVHYKQTWKNLKLHVTADAPGTQAVGTMVFEDVLAGCTAEYSFFALFPAVYCGEDVMGQVDNDGDPNTPDANDTDDDGDAATPVNNDKDDDDDPATPVDNDDADPSAPDVDADEEEYIRTDAVDAYCDPKSDPANGRPFGSGINPDFKTVCDPNIFYCQLVPGTELIR